MYGDGVRPGESYFSGYTLRILVNEIIERYKMLKMMGRKENYFFVQVNEYTKKWHPLLHSLVNF